MDKSRFIDSLKAEIEKATRVVITSHKSPDDDSISCVLAINYWIKKNFPKVQIKIVYESEVHQRWQIFAGYDQIESNVSLAKTIETNSPDLVICCDANQYQRFTEKPEILSNFEGPKFCIDHHKSQPDQWTAAFIDTNASSAAEIMYQLFYDKPDSELAKVLLLGILGDTGNLRFIDHTQVYIYPIVARLVEDAQINIQSFKASYDYYSNEAIEVAKKLIANQKTYSINEWPSGNISYLSRQDYQKYDLIHIKEGVNLYTVTFSRLQKEVSWSIVLYPTDGCIKVSSRSQPGSINVRKLMEALEIGSGHDYAAGGTWEGKELQAEDKLEDLVDWLQTHEPMID